MKRSPEFSKALVALIVYALVLGLFGPLVRELSRELQPIQTIYVRVGLAFLICAALFRRHLKPEALLSVSRRDWKIFFVQSFFISNLATVFYTKACLLTSLGNVTFMAALPFTALWGILLYRERLNAGKAAALTLSIFGAALIVIKDFNSLIWGYAELLAMLSALTFSLGLVLRKSLSPGLGARQISLYSLGMSTLMLILHSILAGEGWPHITQTPVVLAAVLAAICIASGALLFNYAFKHVSSILAGNILMLEMVFAPLLGYTIYGEILNARELSGGGLIVLSVIALAILEKREGRKLPPPLMRDIE